MISSSPSTGGDSNFDGSTNSTLQFVNPAAQAPLLFTLAASGVYGSTNALSISGGSGLGGVSFIVLSGPGEIVDATNLVITAGFGEVVVQATKGADQDYAGESTNASVSALPASLTIIADTQVKVYGAAVPTLTASYIGFVNGDGQGNLTVPPMLTTTATAGSHVAGGPYSITASGALDSNYSITYVNGTLLVLAAPLTITANNESKVYGQALPTLSASYAGFVNGDIPGNLTFPPILTTTATAASHVSVIPYAITVSGAVDSDYFITYVAGGLTVTPASLTIFANNESKTYGQALPTLTASYAGLVNGDTSASLATLPTLTTTATASSHVSGNPYAITAAGAVDADYTISYVAGTLTVTPTSLFIFANNVTKVYGQALPTLTASYDGFVNGDTSANLTTPPTLTTTATAGSHVNGSPYSINASGAVDADYSISYVSGSLAVIAAPLTITANNQIMTYGGPVPTLTASYSGFVNGDTSASLSTSPTLTTTATASSSVAGSPYSVTASGAVDSDYTIAYVTGALVITGVPLTITALNQTQFYGQTNPSFTFSYSGFVNGDTVASLTPPPSATTTATAFSSPGTYPITPFGAVEPNYIISYVNGTLLVTPAVLLVTPDNQSRLYGATNPPLTVTYSGFVNEDGTNVISGAPILSTAADVSSPVGTYDITASVGTLFATNYTFTFTNGVLTVGKAILTIAADNLSRTYGATNPPLTYTLSGFEDGDGTNVITGAPLLSTVADTNSPVGTYDIVITNGTFAATNYALSFTNGTLSVTPATLTATATDQSRLYGSANPALTLIYSGFVNGQNTNDIEILPTAITAADTNSPVGSYTITATGGSDTNYIFNLVNGTLTVTPAPLQATADNLSRAYGATNPVLTVSYIGFVNGDTAASLTAPPTVTTSADASSHVSGNPYSIIPSGAVDANYTISYVDGALTVTAAPLTITADNQTKLYGAAVPILTASYGGFVNEDDSTSLTTPPTLTTTATASSHVSGNPYAINASGAADSDYMISYISGTLTVAAAPLTITVNSQTKVYGAPLPALTASYSGFLDGDTLASLTTPPILATTATAGSHVSGNPYAITGGGAVDSDYEISYVNGALTVTPADLSIFAGNQTKVYGAALPTLTAFYKGFVNEDTSASLTTQPALTTTATASSHVSGSPYAIIASGAADADYDITYFNGSLTVTPAPLTITANSATTTYGAALPALTASYTGFVNGDMAGNLTFPPIITTTATPGSHVSGSPYSIIASGAVDADYAISYVNGTLTVTAAALTITANSLTMIYGGPVPTLTASYSGLANGDTSASLTTQPTLATTATSGSHVSGSPFAITASGAFDSDYLISYVNGALTVVGAPLTIRADNQTKAYGAALPTLTASYTGLVNGDTPMSLSTPPTLATTATPTSPMGAYPITASGAVDPDYVIGYVAGTLSVTPVTLTVTANGATRPYGTTNPVFTGTIVGLLDGDTITASYSCDAVTNSPAGVYQIVPALVDPLGQAGNYNVFLIDAELNVVTALELSTDPLFYVVGDPAIDLDTNAMVNDGDSVNYADGLLTVTVVTNAGPGDELAVASQGTNAGQISVQGTNVSYGGVAFATLSQTSNSLVVALGSNSVTSGALTALLREVTFATDDANTNFLVIQVALSYGSNTVLASRLVALDSPPVANNVVITATKGLTVTIPISELLTNVTDVDGYVITLASVNSISEKGGRITTNATTLTYTPPNNLTGNEDEFEVLYSDGHGGETVGFVTFEFLAPNELQIDASQISTAGIQLTFGGTPGTVYDIQVSTDLLNWSFLETVTATSTGVVGVLDAAAKSMPYRFYRAVAEE